MKDDKLGHKNEEAHNAEFWVTRARTFGEKCVAIQQDHKLSLDQKMEKQKQIGKELSKEIQSDFRLGEKDKERMQHSIDNYLHNWETLHRTFLEATQQKSGDSSKKPELAAASKNGGAKPKK